MATVPLLVDADGPSVVFLRLHSLTDTTRVVEQSRDPRSRRWTTVPLDYHAEDARRFITEAIPAGWELGTEWGFAVDVDGRFGGTVSLRPEGRRRAEVAFGAHPDIRGTGAMERALRLLLGWGFDERGLGTVSWWANRGNLASRKLAWRLGFDIAPVVVRGWLEHRGELVDGYVGTLRATDDRRPRTRWLESPRIDSSRLPLRLRAFRGEDLEHSPEDTASVVLRDAERAAGGSGLSLTVAALDDDRLMGKVSLFDVDWSLRTGEIGFWVHPEARRRGVATEGVRLLLRHALVPEEDGGLGLLRVHAHAAVGNTGSRAVLLKAGLSEVRVVPGGVRTAAGLVDAVLHEAVVREGDGGAR